jgi:hypothetical protein
MPWADSPARTPLPAKISILRGQLGTVDQDDAASPTPRIFVALRLITVGIELGAGDRRRRPRR